MSKRSIALKDWDDTTALQAAETVGWLVQQPGWEFFLAGLEQHERSEHKQLLAQKPTDNGAEYADRVGQLKGLRKAAEVARTIIDNGRAIEEMDRKEEVENG